MTASVEVLGAPEASDEALGSHVAHNGVGRGLGRLVATANAKVASPKAGWMWACRLCRDWAWALLFRGVTSCSGVEKG
ncbi:hypothetical protein TIFTF001_042054 [Ficus carica]|uniref:Uncharacterized protein n=1 Tax=Ficus carica TaxID=3494 RepID=A0AA87ZK27_FICCA|nr:hypothetical protein TIFTF001_042029 [Ficus carica]GMN34354.1 hypothetical protein TIFTF001_042037 [Ficus carica]GMN34399.1 hypothetical protein TIFTF001_042046 [Ficus carica]GMN34430.1 hypothetical protein TIFTF001_042054 [Ficus carica]